MMDWMRRKAPVVFLIVAVTFVGGFLLVDTSGLLTRGAITPTTAVATVNGEDILATRWFAMTRQLEQQETEGTGRTITLDDRRRIEDRAYEELVTSVLLRQEYERRGIRVSDEEVRTAAQLAPPPDLMAAPDLQTDGQFDPAKYQRFLASPAARQSGLLMQLEAYYRSEIPRQKLFEQIAGSAFIGDEQLRSIWTARRDSAQASFVRWDPEAIPDEGISVTDGEIRRYYETHKQNFDRPGRASVSLLVIPRATTAADTAAVMAHAAELRREITDGQRTFEEVARTESADSVSAARGGDLGRGPRGRFVDEFEDAAVALRVGEISQPVLSPFGYHLIRVDERRADTMAVRHILVRVQQSDSAAAATDRRADSLARIAALADDPRKLDEASRTLGIPISRGLVIEGEPFTSAGRYVPGVSAWATGGVQRGEISELFDWDEGYAIARLDSLVEGGTPKLDEVKEQVRTILIRLNKLDRLITVAQPFATDAAATSMEQAAQAQGLQLRQSGWFTRITPANELGQVNEAIGAAFALPLRQPSAPIRTLDGVFVLRVDQRIEADTAEFESAKEALREEEIGRLREERVRGFMINLRENARITDRRKQIAAAAARAVDEGGL